VNTTGYMPSYVEWLTCLEMEQQVNGMRKKAATNSATTEGRGARTVVRPGTPANSRVLESDLRPTVPCRAIWIRRLNHQCNRLLAGSVHKP